MRAVFHATPEDELPSLEWKSTLDWSAPGKAARVHVARTVIGMANRMPDDAGEHFEGYGIMLVGVEPGRLAGVTRVDPADLDAWITPYVGEDGPRWSATWVTLDGVDVLAILVRPPRNGDPIHAARREGDRITDGQVLVRTRGGTAPASSKQLHVLQQRLVRGPDSNPIPVDLEVVTTAPLTRLSFDADAFLRAERSRLLDRLPRPATERHGALGSLAGLDKVALSTNLNALLGSGMMQPESRSVDDYKAQVHKYMMELEAAIPEAVRQTAPAHLEPVLFTIFNRSNKNVPSLEVQVHVPGNVTAATPERRGAVSPPLPPAPRVWGPRSALASVAPLMTALPPHLLVQPGRHAGPRIENGGSVTITFNPVDLRPLERRALDEIILLVEEPPGDIEIRWVATSTGHDGQITGVVHVPVGEREWGLLDHFADGEDE